jgi:hypothetical protein
MAGDDRVAMLFFLLSVLLHLGLLAPPPCLQPRQMPPKEEPPQAQYVVRLAQPARSMTPLSPPLPTRPQPRPEPTRAAREPWPGDSDAP